MPLYVGNKSSGVSDIKDLTIKIQNCFMGTDQENLKWPLLKEFKSKYLGQNDFSNAVVTSYITLLSTLIDSLKPNLFVEKSQESLFDEIFLEGVTHEAFLLLVNRLYKNDSFVEQKVMELLLKFLRGSSLDALMMYQCQNHQDWDLKYVSKSNVWDSLITCLISLPERIANKTKGNFSKLFSPLCYTPLLFSSIIRVLSSIHNCLQNSQDCSVEFLAKLTGRLCLTGNADIVAKKYAKELINVSDSDFIWRRISQNFITKLPSNALDSFITNLLLTIPWYGYVEWILGDEGAKNEKINYIMTVKLVFVRSFEQDLILQNIIGYFASSSSRLPHFVKIVDSLLNSWVDKRSLSCQNARQKLYFASTLMVCAGWMGMLKEKLDTKAYINKILQGTQLRLESTEDAVRSQGMIVAENFIKHITPDAPPLKFEHSDTKMVDHLKGLLKIPDKPVDSSMEFEDLRCFEEVEIVRTKEENESFDQNDQKPAVNSDLLDSDDELEEYDMSQDISTKTKQPLYLRDCMKGLIEQEDADYTEQCLIHAEELIKKNSYATQEVAEEMSKIMLHLDNKFAFDNFIALRHKTMITLTVESPIVVSSYLISQFCARDYNIRQRLDILEVLAASSMALSYPDPSLKAQPHLSCKDPTAERAADWKLLTQQRIEAKTRRFTKTPQPVLRENKFSSIAGLFFFPLLASYEKGESHFDVSKDNYVLGRFISTLGIIMYASTNTVHCRQMGTTFLQFLASVRSHSDVSVRQSVLFAIAATYMSIPFSVLFSEMLPELIDTNDWLQSVIEKDPESSCMERAIYTLNLLQSKASEEGPSLPFGGLVIPES